MWSTKQDYLTATAPVDNDATTNTNNNTTAAMTMMAQLQQRIGQLQYELQDRTKWEAIRLKEFLIMKEKEVSDQLRDLNQIGQFHLSDHCCDHFMYYFH
jgi:hypothetical protein